MSVRVEPVRGRAGRETFIRLPERLYRDDPHWIAPLRLERRMHLSPRNPVFRHLIWQGWLAWRGREPVGRISAQVDALHRRHHGGDTGHFGMLEAVDDPAVFAALFAAAQDWLLARGARRISGPFSFTINQESGLLVEGFEQPPAVMMGHGRPYYGPRVEALGYRPAVDLLAYWVRADELHFTPAMTRLMAHWRERVRIRALDRSRFGAEMETLRDIFNDAWSGNWGFVPFTGEEFHALGKNLKRLVPADTILIAEVDGRPDGFIVGLPNLNEAIAPLGGRLLPLGWLRLLWRLQVGGPTTARVPLMGVRRAHHHSRLAPALALLLIEALEPPLRRHGIEASEMSWILESNAAMRHVLEHIGPRLYKRYRLYEKDL